ncbi:DUF4158 domain-containing protein [Actinomadura nitritigenes]|uniref:DUF4158 domain-containing protein n=1 Tax=Actinomadura nitritigenes TaxID=134602 RepID=UPI003D8EE4BD
MNEERELIAGKRGATRLGFAILQKFCTRHGRFPRGRSELADEVVEHVAKQVQVPTSEFGFYEWSGSTIEYHRGQIRAHLGFRVCTLRMRTRSRSGWPRTSRTPSVGPSGFRRICPSVCVGSGSSRRPRGGSRG